MLSLIFDIGWVICKARTDSRERYRPLNGYHAAVSRGTGPRDYYNIAAIGMHASYNDIGVKGLEKNSEYVAPTSPTFDNVVGEGER
jgi:hypothetical protein